MIIYFLFIACLVYVFFLLKPYVHGLFADRRIDCFIREGREDCDRIDTLQCRMNCMESYKRKILKKLGVIEGDISCCECKKKLISLQQRRARFIFLTEKIDTKISKILEKQNNIINRRGYE